MRYIHTTPPPPPPSLKNSDGGVSGKIRPEQNPKPFVLPIHHTNASNSSSNQNNSPVLYEQKFHIEIIIVICVLVSISVVVLIIWRVSINRRKKVKIVSINTQTTRSTDTIPEAMTSQPLPSPPAQDSYQSSDVHILQIDIPTRFSTPNSNPHNSPGKNQPPPPRYTP